ncbi:MAG: DUF7010 family protein [Turicibacter sp.]
MNLIHLQNELSLRCKNGIGFLLSATLIWSIILVIFLLPLEIEQQNLFTFFSTGIMFPVAILCSKLIKSDWNTNDHPLGMLGLYLNLAQLMYFPILFFTFNAAPEFMIIFFAIITVAHLFPYGWLYNEKAYYILSPLLSVILLIISWMITISTLWVIPAMMIISLIVLNSWLFISYTQKVKHLNLAN